MEDLKKEREAADKKVADEKERERQAKIAKANTKFDTEQKASLHFGTNHPLPPPSQEQVTTVGVDSW